MLLWEGQKKRLCCGSLKQQLLMCSAGPGQTQKKITQYNEKRQQMDLDLKSCIIVVRNDITASTLV